MENEQLVKFIKQDGNDELLPLLWDKNRALISQKCYRVYSAYSNKFKQHGFSLDDFLQEGYDVLLFAVDNFNPDKNFKFTTYFNHGIRNTVRRLLQNPSDVLNLTGTESIYTPLVDDESLTIADTVPDETATDFVERTESSDEYQVLYEEISKLPDDLKEIISAYYFKGQQLKDLAEEKGVSSSYITELHKKAVTIQSPNTTCLKANRRLH